jgi:type II secretory pathway pseudopilin PulG
MEPQGEPAAPAPASAPKKTSTLTIVLIVGAIFAVLALPCCGILATLLMPALMKARQRAEEAKALQLLHELQSAQELYRMNDPDKNGKNDYAPSLAELAKHGLIDAQLGSGEAADYKFVVHLGADPMAEWWGTAQPTDGSPYMLYFYVDENAIRAERGQPANSKSPVR